MNISELKVGQGKVDIELVVKSKSDVRTFNKYGKDLRVCNAVGADSESGEIKISLWNDDCDKINQGDKIKITNGYVSEFNGEKQLSSGKFGKIEVLGKGEEEAESSAEKKKVDKKPSAKKVPAKKDEEESEEDFDDFDEEEAAF